MIIKKFTPPEPLETAVLFLVFNRLDTTKQVFEAIREAKPPRLYIAADGARETKEGEKEKIQTVRDFILNNIDWDCEVKTLFRENNLGCKMAVSGAIDWFFENEEQGIILEDDCLPSQSFFWYCEELLNKYKDDMRVGQIGANNFQNGIKRGEADYYFSVFSHIWGWASWANRWEKYDVNLSTINNTEFIDKLFKNNKHSSYWIDVFKKMKNQEIDTWDYQWTLTLWSNKQLSISPNINLISNIGFGAEATHTTSAESEFSKLQAYELVLKNHPKDIIRNYQADEYTSKMVFYNKNIIQRILNKFLMIFK
jgi:hypothetical protein